MTKRTATRRSYYLGAEHPSERCYLLVRPV
jgi:hypothetical protein